MKDLLRKRWVVTTLAIIVIVLGGGFGSLQYTNQPGFCQSCHIMDPFYQSWKASAHSNVACVDCHYAPGEKYKISAKMKALNQVVLYVTGTYDTKFYAHINDASCMTSGCHGTNTPGKTMYNGKVRFDHATHYGKSARGMELRCTSCHSNNIGDQHIAADTTTCYLCHFKDRVSGSSPVPQQFCLDCHEMDGHGKSLFLDDPLVLPAMHYQKRLIDRDHACFQCHTNYAMFGDLRAKVDGLRHVWVHYMEEPPAKLELYEPYPNTNCLHCHEDARSFAEAVPHRDQLDALYRGERSCLECHEQGHARELVEEGALWLPDL